MAPNHSPIGSPEPDEPPKRRCGDCGEVTLAYDSRDLCECEREMAVEEIRLEDSVTPSDPAQCGNCERIVEPTQPDYPPGYAPEPDRHGNVPTPIRCPECGKRGSVVSSARGTSRQHFCELWELDDVDLREYFDEDRLTTVLRLPEGK